MSNNYFSFKQFTIHQDRCAMKVGTDGTLLGAWADMPTIRNTAAILDAGTGTGLIALMMAQRFTGATIRAIDIDPEAVAQAIANAQASPFAGRISVDHIALQDLHDGPFDAIVCNPPYFIDSLRCPDQKRTAARHADTLSYTDLMSAAFRLLTDDGELSVVIPAECLSRMHSAAAIAGLFVKRECGVKTTERKAPKRYLVAYTKHQPETDWGKSEIIIGSNHYCHLLGSFYLNMPDESSKGRETPQSTHGCKD